MGIIKNYYEIIIEFANACCLSHITAQQARWQFSEALYFTGIMKFMAYSRPKAFNERPHNDIVGKNDVLSNGKCLRMLQRLNCREIYLAFQKLSMIMAMLLLIGLHNSENSFTFFLFLSV